MTQVFIVTEGEYSGYLIVAVFSTKDLAEAFIEQRKKHYETSRGYTRDERIEEYVLDEVMEDQY